MFGAVLELSRCFAIESFERMKEDIAGLDQERVFLRVHCVQGNTLTLLRLIDGAHQRADVLQVSRSVLHTCIQEVDLMETLFEFSRRKPHLAYTHVALPSRGAMLILHEKRRAQYSMCSFYSNGDSAIDLPIWVGNDVTHNHRYQPWYMAYLEFVLSEEAEHVPQSL